jgi:hypothetical protein
VKVENSPIPPTPAPVALEKTPSSYNIRGLKVGDNDLNEAADILFGEISNRPGKQKFETQHIMNTAINRALNDTARYGGSLTKVLQAPYQYQAYSPEGTTTKEGQVIKSQYQKLKAGEIDEAGKQKLQLIKEALEDMKSGKFEDTTGGKTFYVHASDGSLWLGKTQKEAKEAANKHEKNNKINISKWGTTMGLPAKFPNIREIVKNGRADGQGGPSTPAWQRSEGKNPSGGLNQKGISSYRAANPGSKLSMAVTTKPSKLDPESKSAKRRKSFCARMSGMKRRLTSAKTARDPDSRINKSLRKWNC